MASPSKPGWDYLLDSLCKLTLIVVYGTVLCAIAMPIAELTLQR